MSAVNADTADAWRQIAADVGPQRPSAGKRVLVVGGRKHRGRMGAVVRHQISKYGAPYRYASEAQAHMRDLAGRYGWVCWVEELHTGARFWISAEHVQVVPGLSWCDECSRPYVSDREHTCALTTAMQSSEEG